VGNIVKNGQKPLVGGRGRDMGAKIVNGGESSSPVEQSGAVIELQAIQFFIAH